MLNKLAAAAAACLLTANIAAAGSVDRSERKDFQILKDVANTVDRYVHFTIFDDVSASVKDGVVTLTGKVTMPYKHEDIAKRVAKISGVREVRDQIGVLPVSSFDDELRMRIARSIYARIDAHTATYEQPVHGFVDFSAVSGFDGEARSIALRWNIANRKPDSRMHLLVDSLHGGNELRSGERRIAVVESFDVGQNDQQRRADQIGHHLRRAREAHLRGRPGDARLGLRGGGQARNAARNVSW